MGVKYEAAKYLSTCTQYGVGDLDEIYDKVRVMYAIVYCDISLI